MNTKDKSETITGISGVQEIFPEELKKGVASLTKYEFSESENPLYNLRVLRNGESFMRMYDGKYVRLHVNGELMMSDTFMERLTNQKFIDRATGRVLIAGLGVGLIIQNIAEKEEVTEIVVIEKYSDVIDIVEPFIKHPKLKIICADIFDYEMSKTEKFDTIYFDIWPNISTDNLPEMETLHKKYARNKSSRKAFMDSWLRDYLKEKNRRERWDY
jgi:hypothetical protein